MAKNLNKSEMLDMQIKGMIRFINRQQISPNLHKNESREFLEMKLANIDSVAIPDEIPASFLQPSFKIIHKLFAQSSTI